VWLMLVIGWGQTIRLAHPMVLWMRDIVPVIGWMIPVLMVMPLMVIPTAQINQQTVDGGVIGVAGLVMAARFWWDAPTLMPGAYNGWPDYLANDPLLWTGGLWWLSQVFTLRSRQLWLRLAALLLALGCLSTLLMTMQRAVLAGVLVAGLGLGWRMRRNIWFWGGIGFGLVVMICLPQTLMVFDIINRKAMLGWNSRDLEWTILVDMVRHDPLALWFGHGWGSSFASPAVAEWRVTYVRSLAGYLFFKLGLVGLLFFVAILGFCGYCLWRLWRQETRDWFWILLPGIMVPCLLSTAFKFPGWVLVLMMAVTANRQAPATTTECLSRQGAFVYRVVRFAARFL